jgi:hypothetical protein
MVGMPYGKLAFADESALLPGEYSAHEQLGGRARWNVSLRLAVAPAWPAEPVGVAQPATWRMRA